MSLMTCPECGKEVSDVTKKCPHCGYPIKAKQNKDKVLKHKDELVNKINNKIKILKDEGKITRKRTIIASITLICILFICISFLFTRNPYKIYFDNQSFHMGFSKSRLDTLYNADNNNNSTVLSSEDCIWVRDIRSMETLYVEFKNDKIYSVELSRSGATGGIHNKFCGIDVTGGKADIAESLKLPKNTFNGETEYGVIMSKGKVVSVLTEDDLDDSDPNTILANTDYLLFLKFDYSSDKINTITLVDTQLSLKELESEEDDADDSSDYDDSNDYDDSSDYDDSNYDDTDSTYEDEDGDSSGGASYSGSFDIK